MTTEPGQGVITFAGGESVRFTLDFTTVLSEIDATFYGERSGTAHAHASFATQRTPPDVALRCAGAGAAQLPMDLSFTTDSPLVSERAGGGTSPPAGPGRSQAPLRLSVRPQTVRTDRRTAFAFRVVTPDGRPAPGAMVRFAGRRARAGPGGTARIVATLRRPGRRRASAAKAGFRGARATIRVRRG